MYDKEGCRLVRERQGESCDYIMACPLPYHVGMKTVQATSSDIHVSTSLRKLCFAKWSVTVEVFFWSRNKKKYWHGWLFVRVKSLSIAQLSFIAGHPNFVATKDHALKWHFSLHIYTTQVIYSPCLYTLYSASHHILDCLPQSCPWERRFSFWKYLFPKRTKIKFASSDNWLITWSKLVQVQNIYS